MDTFEELLSENLGAVERFVRFRVGDKTDADDILQEVYISAYKAFGMLRDKNSFKAWIISIARNKCNDYFRNRAKVCEISLEDLSENILSYSRFGRGASTAVSDTIERLGDKDRQILYLSFWSEMPQADIAKMLDIPVGTVKSRLHAAKERFRKIYPRHGTDKCSKTAERNGVIMKTLPDKMPQYKIEKSEKSPFDVKFEELPNWFIIPRVGEKITWGTYETDDGRLSERVTSEATCKIMLHGVEGVEIKTLSEGLGSEYADDAADHCYYAQLTDTHCRWLGESYIRNGMRHMLTFLDGDDFIAEWGWGEGNCGSEVNISARGDIIRVGTEVITKNKKYLHDIVGRYNVTISDITYDTDCIMMIYEDGAATEQYIDKNGRTVLWRRFNKNDWAYKRYEKIWTEMLPDNERIIINGKIYVHWYDCISDYIFG